MLLLSLHFSCLNRLVSMVLRSCLRARCPFQLLVVGFTEIEWGLVHFEQVFGILWLAAAGCEGDVRGGWSSCMTKGGGWTLGSGWGTDFGGIVEVESREWYVM